MNQKRNKTQKGGRVLMPIQYFGGQLNRYFPAGSPQLNPLPSAYGKTIARSFGTTDPTLLKLNATSPNLGPMGLGSRGENMSCGIQTGGKRKNKSKTHIRKKHNKSRKKKGGEHSRRFMKTQPEKIIHCTNDRWQENGFKSEDECLQEKANRLEKWEVNRDLAFSLAPQKVEVIKRWIGNDKEKAQHVKNNIKFRAGRSHGEDEELRDDLIEYCNKVLMGQEGGRVLMPIQYFGGQLNRYFPAGSPQLNPLPSAYGKTIARSFGTTDPTLLKLNATSPNLGPMGLGSRGENMSCGIQTGGKRKNKSKTHIRKKHNKSHRK